MCRSLFSIGGPLKNAPSEDGACCVWGGSELLIQLDTVGIGVQGAGEQADEINKCPDAATDDGAAGQDDLDDSIFGVTQVEIVNTEVAQKEGQQDGDQLRLLTGCSTVQCVAVGKADAGAGLGGLTAVMAEAGAGSLGKSHLTQIAAWGSMVAPQFLQYIILPPIFISIGSKRDTAN